AWVAAFLLRFNFEIPPEYLELMWRSLLWVVAIQGSLFWYFGLYRGIWRYASLADAKRIVLTVGVASGVIAAVLYMLRVPVPGSGLVLDPILLLLGMAGSRVAFRMWKERRVSGVLPSDRQPVLVLGAGEAGAKLISELAFSRDWRVVGVLDDAPRRRKREIHG